MARGRKQKREDLVPEATVVGKLYTTDQVAQLFQTSRRTVQYWIHIGQLEAIRIGREWRVEAEALQKLKEAGRTQQDNKS
jgi:excisionase family DNA binding protein